MSATHGITPCQVHTEIWRVSLRPVLRPKLKALEENELGLVEISHVLPLVFGLNNFINESMPNGQ